MPGGRVTRCVPQAEQMSAFVENPREVFLEFGVRF